MPLTLVTLLIFCLLLAAGVWLLRRNVRRFRAAEQMVCLYCETPVSELTTFFCAKCGRDVRGWGIGTVGRQPATRFLFQVAAWTIVLALVSKAWMHDGYWQRWSLHPLAFVTVNVRHHRVEVLRMTLRTHPSETESSIKRVGFLADAVDPVTGRFSILDIDSDQLATVVGPDGKPIVVRQPVSGELLHQWITSACPAATVWGAPDWKRLDLRNPNESVYESMEAICESAGPLWSSSPSMSGYGHVARSSYKPSITLAGIGLLWVGMIAIVGRLTHPRVRGSLYIRRPDAALQISSCGRCGYDVWGLDQLQCPECGCDLRRVGITEAWTARTRRHAIKRIALFAGLFAFAVYLINPVLKNAIPALDRMEKQIDLTQPRSGAFQGAKVIGSARRWGPLDLGQNTRIELTLNLGGNPNTTHLILPPSITLPRPAAGGTILAWMKQNGIDTSNPDVQREANFIAGAVRDVEASFQLRPIQENRSIFGVDRFGVDAFGNQNVTTTSNTGKSANRIVRSSMWGALAIGLLWALRSRNAQADESSAVESKSSKVM